MEDFHLFLAFTGQYEEMCSIVCSVSIRAIYLIWLPLTLQIGMFTTGLMLHFVLPSLARFVHIMGSCCSDMWDGLRPYTIIMSAVLCVQQTFTFITWLHDKFMTATALLHCIGAMLIIIGCLTIFVLNLPHVVQHLSQTTKPRKTAALIVLIGGILHFVGAVLATSNPIYCNYTLCDVHIFSFMVLPLSVAIMLFADEFRLCILLVISLEIIRSESK